MSIASVRCPGCGCTHTLLDVTTAEHDVAGTARRDDSRPCGCGGIITVVIPTPVRIMAAVAAHQRDRRHRAWIDGGGLER